MDVRSVAGAPLSTPKTGAQLEAETDRVSALLRCPVCQGLSINDSPAEMAVNMKRQTRNMVAEGYTGDQILDYFERSYGEYVRLEPKREGLNWVVWIAPGVAFLAGAFIVWRLSRRRVSSEPEIAAPGIPTDLAPWVERVREIVRSGEAGR